MISQAALVRSIRAYVDSIPSKWTTLWENSGTAAVPYMTVQVGVAGAGFASNAEQERIQGLISFGFVVVAGSPSANSRAEEEASRIANYMENLPGVRLPQPPYLLDGFRDGERWRVGLIVNWEKLP